MSKNFYKFSLIVGFLILAMPLPILARYVLIVFFVVILFLQGCINRLPNEPYFRWSLCFTVFCVLSSIWSLFAKVGLYAVIVNMLPIYLMCYSIILYVEKEHDLKLVLSAFYISAVILLLYVSTFVNFHDLEGERLIGSGDDRMEGWNSNYIAGRMVYAIYIGYFIYWKGNYRLQRVLYALFTILMVIVIFLSGSRTSLLMLFIPLLTILMVSNGHLIRNVGIAGAVLYAGFYLMMNVPILYSNVGVRFEDAINIISGNYTGNEDVSRLFLVQFGIEWFLQRPIFGYGINCFRVLSEQTYLAGLNLYAHNNYVELLVDIGVMGTLIYYSGHIWLFAKSSLTKRTRYFPVLIAIMAVVLFSDIFWVSYYNMITQFMLCVAFCMIKLSNNIKYEAS